MADEEKKEDESGPEGTDDQPKRKGPSAQVKLLGGVLVVIATGAALAIMAIPSKPVDHNFEGPFFVALAEEPIAVNTLDANYTRYVKFVPHAEFIAYDELYVRDRTKDPFYATYLRAQIEEVASDKDLEAVLKGVQRQVFAAELRAAIDPIVFPVHVGPTKLPLERDPATGLSPGVSHALSTFRGRFHDHKLTLDGPARTIRIDDGPVVTFDGSEDDLRVEVATGEYLYLDVSHVDSKFVGEIPIGVHGRLRKVLIVEGIAQ